MENTEARLRVRMSSSDAHYAGNLVAGAKILSLFGDVATELTIRYDGDEGLLRAYDQVEFLAPVYNGDFIEATGRIIKVGNTSRKITFEAYKVHRFEVMYKLALAKYLTRLFLSPRHLLRVL